MTREDDRRSGEESDGDAPLSILISGAGGLIGQETVRSFTSRGYRVTRLVRRVATGPWEISWNPQAHEIDPKACEGFDAVVHLAGAGIAERRWTRDRKKVILDSRVNRTKLLCETLARIDHPPRAVICASAIGFYGNRGEEMLDEESESGEGFLADVCRRWEATAQPAVEAGIRLVFARFGIVLSPAGGALSKMLLPFRLGLGGKIGNGLQYWSWVSLDDAVGAINHSISCESLAGAVNVVSPEPVRNAEFARTLGRILKRPAFFPMPAKAARLMLGEMADELLLSSSRVAPRKLIESGYRFADPTLKACLRGLSRKG